MQKEKFKVYTLAQMEKDDRFYFVGDRKKTVYTLSWMIPFETVNQKGFWKRYGNCRLDGNLQTEQHLDTRKVVFLRNINDNPGQNSNQESAGQPEGL